MDRISPRHFFLLDSLGALLSIASGLILSRFEAFFGIPASVLYSLAAIAGLFFSYSFLNFLLNPKSWRFRMRVIVIANISYCGLTAGLIFYLYLGIKVWGTLFFVLEILVVLLLSLLELKKSR